MNESQRIARERDFHNQRFADDSERAERVGRFYSAIGYGFELFHHRVREESVDRVVLEYGCGTDGLAFALAPVASAVIGIDISDVAIERARRIAARKKLDNVRFMVDNAEAMQLADAEVDVVVGSGIVHHLDIVKAMHEVRRVLRKGGIAIFAEPLGHNPALNWYRKRTPELRTEDEHPLLNRDLKTMAREFSSMRVTYFGLIAPILGFVFQQTDPRKPFTRIVWWLDQLLCRIPGVRRFAWFSFVELRA